jgi:hypothetical protein
MRKGRSLEAGPDEEYSRTAVHDLEIHLAKILANKIRITPAASKTPRFLDV